MKKKNVHKLGSPKPGWYGSVGFWHVEDTSTVMEALEVVASHLKVIITKMDYCYLIGPFRESIGASYALVEVHNYAQHLLNRTVPNQLVYIDWKLWCAGKLEIKKERKERREAKKHFATYPSS